MNLDKSFVSQLVPMEYTDYENIDCDHPVPVCRMHRKYCCGFDPFCRTQI